MLKKMTMSVVVIMLAVSTAQAIDPPNWGSEGFNIQSQDVAATLTNVFDFDQSKQNATNHQWVDVYNKHKLDNAHNIYADQHQKVFLSEFGDAYGNSANLIFDQAISTAGSQLQLVKGGTGPKAQWQAQALSAGQFVGKVGGTGSATGNHTAILHESQDATNLAGTMSESSFILGGQNVDYWGGPTAVGAVQSEMNVATQQSQVVVN